MVSNVICLLHTTAAVSLLCRSIKSQELATRSFRETESDFLLTLKPSPLIIRLLSSSTPVILPRPTLSAPQRAHFPLALCAI